MRSVKFVPREYYHLYGRGNNKQLIFLNNADRARFLFLLLYFQAPVYIAKISRFGFGQHSVLATVDEKTLKSILKKRYVELVNFVLMPNHFHCTVRELRERGISQYMQRVLNAYTKYFNIKYEKSGHVFQGPFQAVHIGDNEQLLHLSAYIHRNPREIKQWRNKESAFYWSSYQDYINANRWGALLKSGVIISQFAKPEEYRVFVQESGIKEFIDQEFLLDLP